MYQAIAAAGETVVSSSVLWVDARNYNWTDTGVSVSPGEQVWFDFRADGIGTIGPQWGKPRGPEGDFPNNWANDPNFYRLPSGSLVGGMALSQGGGLDINTIFEIGRGLYNWKPPTTGEVLLLYNDNHSKPSWYNDNSGGFIVRVVVTK